LPHPHGLFESGNGDHALAHRYPLLTCILPKIVECVRGSARRLALEKWVLDGRAIGGWRVRPLADFLDMYPGTGHEKAGEMNGGKISAAAGALAFSVW
jgi:hypothetical protein